MKLTAELHFLTLVAAATTLMWIPYTLARIVRWGLPAALANPDHAKRPDPVWARRARLAHANAIENLAVFAPLVLIAAMIGTSTPATVLAAKVYLVARLVHYGVYSAGIPVVRTLAFIVGFGATLVFAVTLLGHVA
ncbi:MAPEG family protein [Caballeronia ptereochthonis]|uniref:MAPEG family protein n=1 Tax=Caballeronia ptereochthonis TaxID=1777144 RepID=A0A158E1Y0_9BURK|nr:MAPEG family protein [Caballeronia ptereochthonis]SAL00690.1 MAPEG family protein [Caballeronia ptereochthonis]